MKSRLIRYINLLMAIAVVVGIVGAAHAGQIEIACYPSNPTCSPGGGTSVPDCGPGGEGDCGSQGSNAGMGGGAGDNCMVETEAPGGFGDPGQNQEISEADPVCDDNGTGGYTFETLLDGNGNVIGYEVFHSNGAEVAALCFRESESAIESVTVSLAHGAMARIRKIDTGVLFQGGPVDIKINGAVYTFATNAPGNINDRILNTLVRARYSVSVSGNYMLIGADPTGASIDEVGFATSEPNIYSSEVSLEPWNDNPYMLCFPPEPADPGFVPAG